ncbi:MAG: 4-(cytidine 5'-diphospho)-2-C-methyl-D-erythritol kinase [Candidatus Marinimicrobia bacterium]|nr:4-(cytidine 5'-diphospho)-2-C-methyl-D-erythritol kinase [Candidatus Neomarinimicrobiota bacterium]
MSLQLRANAKINLGLRITGRVVTAPDLAPDLRDEELYVGYHTIHTLFQELDFGDRVTLEENPSGEIALTVTGPWAHAIPSDETNLCVRAARALQDYAFPGRGARIRLEKNIPPGSGLGGGSSDGAAVMRGLNRLWNDGQDRLDAEELSDIALAEELGADIAFFLEGGGLQLGEYIGSDLIPITRPLPYQVLLVIPPFSVDTAWAYGQFAGQQSFAPAPGFDRLILQDPIPWEAFTNDFEAVVFPHHGELAEIKGQLLASGAVWAGLSGSGSAVYGVFDSPPNINSLGQRFPGCRVVLVNLVTGAEHAPDST